MVSRCAARVAALVLFVSAVGMSHASQPQLVHEEKSLYRNIFVVDDDGLRCMRFGHRDGRQGCVARDAPQRLVLPYIRSLMGAFFAKPEVDRVLVIGFGVGTLPGAIRAYDKDIVIDSVELDPAVVRVAKTYFGFQPDPKSRIHIDDGRVFVRRQQRAGVRYDIVFIDAFDVKYIPDHMLTREFLDEVKQILTPHGVVAANTFASRSLQPYELATYQSVFGRLMTLQWADSGNRVLLAGRMGLPPIQTMQNNAAVLEPRFKPFGVSAGSMGQMLRFQPAVHGVRLLTDQYSPANVLLNH